MGKQLLEGINSYLKRSNRILFEAVVIDEKIHSREDAVRILKKTTDEHGEPFAVVNAIGKVGKPNVDWCEDHKEETYFTNVDLPLFLAETAWENQLPFIHISSGCIFDGKGPFASSSKPNFIGSYYSYTKLTSEARLIDLQKKFPLEHLEIHRIRVPFVAYPDPRNLITKLISYETIVDAPNSITYVPDYTEMVAVRLTVLFGNTLDAYTPYAMSPIIINATNPGAVTHRQIMAMIDEISGVEHPKKFITPEDLHKIVRVPRTNCVLVASDNGIQRPVEQALHDAITQYFGKVWPVK